MHGPVAIPKARSDKRVFVHVMPWFETPASAGAWGMHWTMANRDPERVIDGKREIASAVYPLTGPYASADPVVIEYQLLLMKYSGIDGVILDWPGTLPLWDYPRNAANCDVIADATAAMGLEFFAIYEDRNIAAGLDRGAVADPVAQARADLQTLRDRYFARANYARVGDRPLVGVFGPIHFREPRAWSAVLDQFEPRPALLTLWDHAHHAGSNAAGEFAWVGPDRAALEEWTESRERTAFDVAAVFPAFRPFYAEGGWGTPPDTGFQIPHDGTATFCRTLDRALASALSLVQLVTWNDYGEGTSIEPTREYGFAFLTALQSALGVEHTGADLELIHRLWVERVQAGPDARRLAELGEAARCLASREVERAASLIARVTPR